MLTKYIGKFFINDREIFKVVSADFYTVTLLICPLHPSISSSNYRFVEETLDVFTCSTAEGIRRIEKSQEITKEEFEEQIYGFVSELLSII